MAGLGRFQKQPSGKEAESSENKEESKCSDNCTKADPIQEAVPPSSIPTNPETNDNLFSYGDIEYGADTFGSEYDTYDSSNNYDSTSNYTETDFMNQAPDCLVDLPTNDNTANRHESYPDTTDKSSAAPGVFSLLSKKRSFVAAADSSSLATTNDALQKYSDGSSPGTSDQTKALADNETDEMNVLLMKKSKDNHSGSLDSDLNQESNLNSNDAMESSTSNDSFSLSNNDSEIVNVARKGDGQNATIDSSSTSSFSNDTPKEVHTGSSNAVVVHVSNETSSPKERTQGQQKCLVKTASIRPVELDLNVSQVQTSDPHLEQDKTTNKNDDDDIMTKEKRNELSAIDSIKDKEEIEQDNQHGCDAHPSLLDPTNSLPPSKLQEKNVTTGNIVEKEHSTSETHQNLSILDVNANEQRASRQEMVVEKSVTMNKDTLLDISGTVRNSQEDASHIQIGQSSANMENGDTAKFDLQVSKQIIDHGTKPLSNVFVSPSPRQIGRQHAVVRTFSTTTFGGKRILPEAPVRGNNVNTSNNSTSNVFQPITPSPPPPSHNNTGTKQSNSSSPISRSGTIVSSGKAKMHKQMDPKVASKASTFSSPSLTNAVSSRKTESVMSFDELLQEFTNDLTESGDTVKRSCANLIDLNVKLCTSQSVALRIHAAFDDLLEEAQMLCDL